MIFLSEQLRFLHFLQEWRSPAVDTLFRCLNFFDTDYFISILLAFIWIGCSWRWGARLTILIVFSGLVNAWAKMAFALPRPIFLEPSLGIVQLHDYGFPSGGAQTSLLFAGLIIYYWKSRWAVPLGIAYCLLISFSRVFLGVHFPIDILGGWVLGTLILFIFIKTIRPIERWLGTHSQIALLCVMPSAALTALIFRDYKTVFLMTALISVSIGIYLATRFQGRFVPAPELWKRTILGLFGIISSFAVSGIVRLLPLPPLVSLMAQIVAAGVWISWGACPFCRHVLGNKFCIFITEHE